MLCSASVVLVCTTTQFPRAFKLNENFLEYAAAFFILGGNLKDAVNVCIRHLDDFQLAVALARVVEGRDDGPILRDILNETIIPLAFKKGNRWLGSWAFWLLHRRDLAVRILVVRAYGLHSCLFFFTFSDGHLLDTSARRRKRAGPTYHRVWQPTLRRPQSGSPLLPIKVQDAPSCKGHK